MEYFCYARDRPGTGALRAELTEAHWSFMDGYAEGMIARGPTLTDDGETATGSVHIVDLPDPSAARVFAFEEPNYRAGVYGEVLVRRWRNVLGRTMWQFTAEVPEQPRFLVLGHGVVGTAGAPEDLDSDRLIAYGPLLADDGVSWLGTALLVELPDRAAVTAMMAPSAGWYRDIEIHPWCFGGRR